MHFFMPQELAGKLKAYTERNDIDATHAVHRAIRLMTLLDEAQARGATVRIMEDGKSRDLMILS